MLYATGQEQTKELVYSSLRTLELDPSALFSTMGRTAARTLETKVIADNMQDTFDSLINNIKSGDTNTFNELYWEPSSWPKEAKGVGFMEAPRGALAHWVTIKDGIIYDAKKLLADVKQMVADERGPDYKLLQPGIKKEDIKP